MPSTSLQQNSVAFDRSDTKAVKGVAVLMMLFHHVAGFPYKAPYGFEGFQTILSYTYYSDFAMACKFCVSAFLFLGGYGLYQRWKHSSHFSVADSVINLFKAFWKVYFIYIPIAFIFFRRSGEGISGLHTWYNFPRIRDMITEFITGMIGFTDGVNGEWWFLRTYICLIPMGYLFCLAWKKNHNFWIEIFCVFFMDMLFRQVFPGSSIVVNNMYVSQFLSNSYGFASVFFAGIVFAKYDGLCNIKRRILNLPFSTIVAVCAVIVTLWIQTYISSYTDIFTCALLFPALSILFDKFNFLKKPFVYLGKHSTNIWLIHSFYCYYFLEAAKIVYCTRNLWIDLAILLAMSLVSSIAVDFFWKKVGSLVGKFQKVSAKC